MAANVAASLVLKMITTDGVSIGTFARFGIFGR